MITMMMMMMMRGFSVCQVYCSFVSSYSVILLPKPDSQRTHTTSAQGLGEDFTFLFLCSHDFLSPFSKVFYSVGQVEWNKKKKKTCHVKQLLKSVCCDENVFSFWTNLLLHAWSHTTWDSYTHITGKAEINFRNLNFHNYFYMIHLETWSEINQMFGWSFSVATDQTA